MLKRVVLAASLAAALAAPPAYAWGPDGHRTIAAMAAKLIAGSRAEKEVAALLKPGESLESISTWLDCVKGTLCGPQSEEMLAFVAAHPQHNAFHYTDVPLGASHYAASPFAGRADDLVQMIKRSVAVLQGQPDTLSKRQALLVLVHLLGDLQQPLHMGSPFLNAERQLVVPRSPAEVDKQQIFPTQGGNNFQVDEKLVTSLLQGAASGDEEDAAPARPGRERLSRPLHSFWDGTVVKYAMKRSGARQPAELAEQLLAAKPALPAVGAHAQAAIEAWADNSLQVAKGALQGVQVQEIEKRTSRRGEVYYNWRVEVAADYPVTASSVARQQLSLGGTRLAALLQAIWPNS